MCFSLHEKSKCLLQSLAWKCKFMLILSRESHYIFKISHLEVIVKLNFNFVDFCSLPSHSCSHSEAVGGSRDTKSEWEKKKNKTGGGGWWRVPMVLCTANVCKQEHGYRCLTSAVHFKTQFCDNITLAVPPRQKKKVFVEFISGAGRQTLWTQPLLVHQSQPGNGSFSINVSINVSIANQLPCRFTYISNILIWCPPWNKLLIIVWSNTGISHHNVSEVYC